MARVITYSVNFPSYHPRKGEPTYFVEKFWKSIKVSVPCSVHQNELLKEMNNLIFEEKRRLNLMPKHHTIRKGRRWKVGDKFSPRIWSGKPYRSKQLILADDVEVKMVLDVEIWNDENDRPHIGIRLNENTHELLSFGEVANNDGLSYDDLKDWFKVKKGEIFVGQIICWNSDLKYMD